MINSIPHHLCSGCQACVNICPIQCIGMQIDEEGFLYPKVSENCVLCGKCISICPINIKEFAYKTTNITVLAAQNKSCDELKKSSSGGVFCQLAKCIIEQGGIVYGAAFNENLQLCHKGIDRVEDLFMLMGSKYLQSNVGNIYIQVKKKLDEGIKVLFSGTPCQVKGLNCFLPKEYDNLLTVDVICHGVPSQQNFDLYLKFLGKKNKSKVKNIYFRDKSGGWENYKIKIEFYNGKVITESLHNNFYMRAYLKNLNLRQSCYNCPANNFTSGSDITLGDFWNIEKVSSTFSNDRGTSAVILKTDKGNKAFLKISSGFNTEKRNISEVIRYNPVIKSSVLRPKNRENYISQLCSKSIKQLDKQFVETDIRTRIKTKLYNIKVRLFENK